MIEMEKRKNKMESSGKQREERKILTLETEWNGSKPFECFESVMCARC